MTYYGIFIHRQRLLKNWSQKGLCRGICAVSYLSKIEQGKAVPSDEILQLLLNRLGVSFDRETAESARELAENAYETLFCGDMKAFRALLPRLQNDAYLPTAAGLDLLLLREIAAGTKHPLEPQLESCMEPRQLALQRLLQNRYQESAALFPHAYFYYQAGVAAYEQGENYSAAIEQLQTAYDLASKEGAVHLMLSARFFIGNCYCNQGDLTPMLKHYKIAGRLADALHDEQALETIHYNTAAAQIEIGSYEEAYSYFSALTAPDVMCLHKLAVCCEKTGRTEEALAALDLARTLESTMPPNPLAQKMCDVVRFRLLHENYLEQPAYGELLLSCFQLLQKNLPVGYASFHLPWVLEWYTAARQYKKVCELISNFPFSPTLNRGNDNI